MQFKKRGEITVFIALIMSIMIVFIITMLGGMRRYAAKNDIILAVDSALISCFGEYNQYLYDKYHLMYIDTSYKENISEDKKLESHLTMYIQTNLLEEKSHITGLKLNKIQITNIRRATDNNYKSVIKQMRMYCNECENIKLPVSCSDYEVLTRYINSVIAPIEKSRNEEYVLSELEQASYTDKLNKTLELIERDVAENGSPGIDFNECVTELAVNVSIGSEFDFDYEIERDYAYIYE